VRLLIAPQGFAPLEKPTVDPITSRMQQDREQPPFDLIVADRRLIPLVGDLMLDLVDQARAERGLSRDIVILALFDSKLAHFTSSSHVVAGTLRRGPGSSGGAPGLKTPCFVVGPLAESPRASL
jgi:hypothetical protein